MGAKAARTRMDTQYFTGSAPLILHSEILTAAAGGDTSNLMGVAAWDLYLEELLICVQAQAGDGALPAISLGSSLDEDKYINSYVQALTAAMVGKVVRVDLANAAVVTRVIPAGDIIEVDLDAGGTGGNILSIVAVLMPRQA